MDKYEYKIRADEIKELIAQREYVQAADIADTIDWRRVKSVMMLCTISDLYKINRRYEDARDILLLAYERRPGGRTICYSLCELSIKMEEYIQAVEYYKEFVQVAPKDPGRYILQYKLYETQDVSLEERIEVLEELKKRDYREKWAYELAYLYHRVGLATRCVEECDEMILWFGEGKYVIKAMELKRLHQPLTPDQQEKYDTRFQVSKKAEEVPTKEPVTVEENLGDTKIYGAVIPEVVRQEEANPQEDMDIHVKTMDVGEYNTINLQAELAAGLREVLGEEKIQDPITRSIMAPMLESDTESLDYPQIDEVREEDLEGEVEEVERSEVFFGETGEIALEEADESSKEDEVADETAEIVMEQMRLEKAGEEKAAMLNAELPKELANVLSQESDGQISLVMPEKEHIEKQITGQMSIEDILIEWERMKRENEEKRKEEVRQHVLEQTGTMFTEFEAAVRDGLLEQLENEAAEEVQEPEESNEAFETEENTEAEEAIESIETQEATNEDEITEVEELVEIEEIEEIQEVEKLAEAQEISEEEEPETPEEPEEIGEFTAVEEIKEEGEFAETEENTEVEELAEIEEPVGAQEFAEVEEIVEVEEITETITETEVEETKIPEAVKPPVARERVKSRALTREERELYAPFVQSRSAREQLVKAVDNISLAAYTGNIIITGEEGMDTLTLAKNMIRQVQLEDSNFSGKVAKISGNALNSKEVAAITDELKNGALILQKASEMNHETAGALHRALQQESTGIIVVLVDTKKAMNQFLAEQEELHKCFTARMDVEALSDDTLVAFGRQYAKEMEYSIDEMGVLALHTRIAELQTIDHIVTVKEVKEIVDEAIRHANKKTVGHFFDILFAKRYDDEDMIILGEKDFA